MNKRTLKALEGSIEKWRQIAYENGKDYGTENCPLCKMFFINGSRDCTGCPVRDKTGRMLCHGSPYEAWAYSHKKHIPSVKKQLAVAELKFLRSLRPSKKRARKAKRREENASANRTPIFRGLPAERRVV